ncbi:hydrolase [Vibrio sp. DW001]|uniref:hydrolase n=1 Tax=Vibrio sp. DW001 TaxID=2912315 RepID=UPI0023B1A327|nr:hydrolase [Vibrio sp. DW001]WED26475.1 hydrolase [Vibrio sp. DW001]
MTEFNAARGLTNPHVQTVIPRMIRKQPLFYAKWQTLETPDGDFLDLAWSEDWTSPTVKEKPIFVLFHGLEGSFESPYANGLMHAFSQQGWLSVMMHFRGCSGRPNRLARAYHSGETEDPRFFLEHIQNMFPDQPKVAIGISLGGNMLVNYLAKYSHDPIVEAATVVSAPLDLEACSSRIEQGFSKVYRNYLLSSLKKNALQKQNQLVSELGVSTQDLKALKTLYGFDDMITAPLHGFKNANDYYQQCSGIHVINKVNIPLQVIHAEDDPFMTQAVIPNFPLNKNIHYRLFKQGGHVGFLSGTLTKPIFWLEQAIPKYYQHIAS